MYTLSSDINYQRQICLQSLLPFSNSTSRMQN